MGPAHQSGKCAQPNLRSCVLQMNKNHYRRVPKRLVMRKSLSLLFSVLLGALAVSAQVTSQPSTGYSTPAPAPSRPELLGDSLTRQFPYSMSGQIIFTSGDADYQ